tara:strand:+ start:102 stop:347 length:246 start_codon:yes stop_codon:yes gene_type:complete
MHLHYRDRELEVLKVKLEERLREFDGVFMNQWRGKYQGQMPVKLFGKFIEARGKERLKIAKELGIEEYELESMFERTYVSE